MDKIPPPSLRNMKRTLLVVALAASIAACTTTPTAPPAVELPAPTVDQLELAHWWTEFNEPALNGLVDEALANNLDLQAAMARIESARAQVELAQADLFPLVTIGADAQRSRSTQVGTNPLPPGFAATGNDFRVGLNASYELDLWGKYRLSTRAAQNDLLATQFARETVRTSVAAEVARAYFGLIAADAQLQLLNDTLKLREQTVALQTDRAQAGVIGDYDLAQAKAERDVVAADIATAQRAVGELESALAVLTGRSPRDIFTPHILREPALAKLLTVPTVPAGLPSNLLERRPDIRQLEKQITAASLRIDRAHRDFLPSVTLTGTLGTESGALRHLFSGRRGPRGAAADREVAGSERRHRRGPPRRARGQLPPDGAGGAEGCPRCARRERIDSRGARRPDIAPRESAAGVRPVRPALQGWLFALPRGSRRAAATAAGADAVDPRRTRRAPRARRPCKSARRRLGLPERGRADGHPRSCLGFEPGATRIAGCSNAWRATHGAGATLTAAGVF